MIFQTKKATLHCPLTAQKKKASSTGTTDLPLTQSEPPLHSNSSSRSSAPAGRFALFPSPFPNDKETNRRCLRLRTAPKHDAAARAGWDAFMRSKKHRIKQTINHTVTSSFLFLVRPGAPFVASLLVPMPGAPSSFSNGLYGGVSCR